MRSNLITKTSFFNIVLVLLIGLPISNVSGQINVLWESRYTSSGTNSDSGKEIAVDASGNVYVTGTSYTNASSGYDIVTIKYDPLGNQLWASTFNGSGNGLDEGRDIAVDASGNVYVTGYTTSTGPNYDYITIMYNSGGTQQWATPYNGTGNGYDEAYSLAIDNLGNCYVTGGSDAGGQGSNFVTVMYNNAGVQQWATPYNGPGNSVDAATQIKLDGSNNVYVSGHSFGSGTDLDIATVKYNNSGVQQWVSRYNGALSFFDVPEALFVDGSNNVYVAGATYGGLATENDYVTIMINSSGTQQWARVYDGPQNEEDRAFDLVADQNQNVYVTGRSMGSGGTAENMVTIKYDSGGNVIWQDTYDGPASAYDDAQQMRMGASGALYVTGYSVGLGTNNDYLTLKYDTLSGNILWKARFDGPASNSDQAFAMEIDAMESIYVTGSSTDPASFKDYSTIKWCQLDAKAGNDTAICLGNSVQLDATTSGVISYTWTPSTGLNNANIANPIATPTTTTMYTVSATNSLGCIDLDTIIITVNALPSNSISTSGATTFCDGDSVVLTAGNATNYSWTPTNETSQSITVYATGTYTVSLTDSNGCNNTAQEMVTVNPLPNVSAGPDATLCNGSSMMLNASGAVNYTWNTQVNLSDSTIANPIINPTIPTSFWVAGEDTEGCINTDTVFIAISVAPTSVISPPVPNDTLYLLQTNGGDIQFFGNMSTNAITYSWKFGDGGNSSAQNPIYTYTLPGLWNVELITTNGSCNDTAYIDIMAFNTTAIAVINKSYDISLYPNPVNNYLNIELSPDYLSNPIVTGSIINSIGEIVKDLKLVSTNKTLNLYTGDLPSGVYFLKLNIERGVIVRPFSISHK